MWSIANAKHNPLTGVNYKLAIIEAIKKMYRSDYKRSRYCYLDLCNCRSWVEQMFEIGGGYRKKLELCASVK
jgi:hypothetical protein